MTERVQRSLDKINNVVHMGFIVTSSYRFTPENSFFFSFFDTSNTKIKRLYRV